MSLNLKILPPVTLEFPMTQKCKISFEKIPIIQKPGTLVQCRTSSGRTFLNFVYPFANRNIRNECFLDKSVEVFSKNLSYSNAVQQNESNDNLIDISEIKQNRGDLKKISVSVEVNEEIFKNSKRCNEKFLHETTKYLIQSYYLVNHCKISLSEDFKSFGLSSIIVHSSSIPDEKEGFQVNKETKLIIENVHLTSGGSFIEMKSDHRSLYGVENVVKQMDDLFGETISVDKAGNWISCSQNAIIIGPTGSGKTSICYKFIKKHNCNLISVKCSDFIFQSPGEREKALRNIFHRAKLFARTFKPKNPILILIEQIEILCPVKTELKTQDSSNLNFVTSELAVLLDELCGEQLNIIVLATSTVVDEINPVLRRPGRFGIEIFIPSLNEINRKSIINSLIKENTITNNVLKYSEILAPRFAKLTQGFVGADLYLLVQNFFRQYYQAEEQNESNNEINYEILEKFFFNSLNMMASVFLRGTDVQVYKSDINFNNIGGMDFLKKTLNTSIIAGLKHPEIFNRFGLKLPKGILLYGPPGCAKTTIAKCLANETNMTLISTSGAEVYSPYVGCAEKFIIKIFDTARKNSPCLIFLDEIDTLIGNRQKDSSRNDVQTRVLSTLLTEMDGIGNKITSNILCNQLSNFEDHVMIVAATNRPDLLDDALIRPGRFDRLIYVPQPDESSRVKILELQSKRIPFETDVNLKEISLKTENFSGADLCNLCNEAALLSLTENIEAISVKNEHFEKILQKIKPSLLKSQIEYYEKFHKRESF